KIEKNAFDRARKLVSIDLPDSVTELGQNLFVYCNNLQSVELPASLKKIPSGFLKYGPPQVTGIVIPDGVTEIGESAFWEAKKLETITIPVSVVKICAKAFYCSSDGIRTVNYKGSSAQKDAIVIENSDGNNDKIVDAAWNCDYVGD
ncbi:MAG: leucine-rich repeat domain-containing protein, partial [Treponema sp.]|nr:leucine-rich repeat domain-containing protein [Treponema sp.]